MLRLSGTGAAAAGLASNEHEPSAPLRRSAPARTKMFQLVNAANEVPTNDALRYHLARPGGSRGPLVRPWIRRRGFESLTVADEDVRTRPWLRRVGI